MKQGRLFIERDLDTSQGEFWEGPCYRLFHTDAFSWLDKAKPNSIHAVVTDPPYGLIEYTLPELEKKERNCGGVWRLPPSFDGCKRSPLPRFTVLRETDKENLRDFFFNFSK